MLPDTHPSKQLPSHGVHYSYTTHHHTPQLVTGWLLLPRPTFARPAAKVKRPERPARRLSNHRHPLLLLRPLALVLVPASLRNRIWVNLHAQQLGPAGRDGLQCGCARRPVGQAARLQHNMRLAVLASATSTSNAPSQGSCRQVLSRTLHKRVVVRQHSKGRRSLSDMRPIKPHRECTTKPNCVRTQVCTQAYTQSRINLLPVGCVLALTTATINKRAVIMTYKAGRGRQGASRAAASSARAMLLRPPCERGVHCRAFHHLERVHVLGQRAQQLPSSTRRAWRAWRPAWRCGCGAGAAPACSNCSKKQAGGNNTQAPLC